MAKLNHYEAMNEVKTGRLRPVYLLYGGEPFLEDELLAAIRQAAVRPDTADFNFHLFHPAPDQVQQALALARTEPFFAEKRLVVVKDCPAFVAARKKQEDEEEPEARSSASDEALIAYLGRPALSTCLVLVAGEGVDSRKKVTKALLGGGGAVECKRLKAEDAAMWAQQRATSYGKKLGDSAAQLLVEKVGPDLRFIDGELQKLSLYVGDARQIAVVDVDTAVGGVAETEIYRLTEAVMLKERTKAMTLLHKVMRQVDHPLQALAALTNRFRQILTVKALVTRGGGSREGAGLAKMKPFPYDKMVGHVRHCCREDIVRALEKLLEADVAMKSGFDPGLTLQTVVVELMS